MKKPKITLGQDEIRTLQEVYNIDVADPDSIKAFKDRSAEILKSLHDTERQIYFGLNPNRRKRIPKGKKCAFCLKSENEVHGMAKLESGFNLCNTCIKTVQNAERD